MFMKDSFALSIVLAICATFGIEIKAQINSTQTVTFMTINLRGPYDVPCRSTDGTLAKRCDRMVAWINVNQRPDVIAFQETNGNLRCGFARVLNDYEMLFNIVSRLNAANPDATYRIAYLTGVEEGGEGGCGASNITGHPNLSHALTLCQMYQGKALIYNSKRLTNLTSFDTDPSSGFMSAYGNVSPPVFRRSLPACNVLPAQRNLISLIDGVSQNDQSCLSPSGKVWVMGGAAFVRLKLINAVNENKGELHIYNVHLHPSTPPGTGDDEHMADFVQIMESKFPNARLYPPVMLGDFNQDAEGFPSPKLPKFRFLADSWTGPGVGEKIIGALGGKTDQFNSHFDFTIGSIIKLATGFDCSLNNFWTDHCSLFFSIKPSAESFVVVNKNSGKVLDIPNSSKQAGTVLIQWAATGGNNQKFIFKPVGDFYTIVAADSGMCLDVPNASQADREKIIQFPCNGQPNQLWKLEKTGDGSYVITSKASNKVLDVPNSSTSDGTQIIQYKLNKGKNQRWILK